MDKVDLQTFILGACLGEDQYRKVSFLREEDFDETKDEPFKSMWRAIKACNGEIPCLYNAIKKTNGSFVTPYLLEYSNYSVTVHIEKYALKLIEMSLRKNLFRLVESLSLKSKEGTESFILSKCLEEIADEELDIFDLSDSIPDYVKPYVSDTTKRRLADYNAYKERRIKEIKNVMK